MPETASSSGAAVRHALLLALHEDRERGSLRTPPEYRALFPGFEREVDSALEELLGGGAREAGPEPAAEREERVGRYRILSELGRGGQGVVYLAEDETLARRVALKLLAPRFVLDPVAEARFRREAMAASRLAHPGVCRVHDVGEVGGLPYIAMEYIQGEALAQRLAAAGGAPPAAGELAARVLLVERVARALHAVHEAGILHRDLKPRNIMLRPDGEPVVLDFGLAHDEAQPVSLTLSGDVFGTPAYMAPEQIERRVGAVDRRTDVHALGAVLYECLTGRRPYGAATRQALYRAILFSEPADPRELAPHVSVDLKLVTLKALAKEPHNRYATAAELADELQRVREHHPVRARPAGPWLRFRRWCRRDPVLATTSLGLFAALLGGWGVTDVLARRTKASELATLRQSDRRTAAVLAREAGELWPVLPEGVPGMDAWLSAVGALRARWPDPEDADAELRGELERLPALIDEVRARRAAALEIRGLSLERHRAEWEATIAALADRARHPVYGGLRLEPQGGLVPIGQDPVSGLFEFAHLQSGAVAQRDAMGRVIVTEEMGLVFVLLPGGWFTMGQCDGLQAWSPDHEIRLDPFFLSKFEMTQGQWLRTRGANPSEYAPGRTGLSNPFGFPFDLRHPVERVTWLECTETARRFGQTLPTEAQWEYAARGDTRTLYWFGDEDRGLLGIGNVLDRSRALAGDAVEGVELDDGMPYHAPVGSLAANPFGLHDVHGNVHEWVRDKFARYENPVRAGDGERIVPGPTPTLCRGGSFGDRPSYAWVITRYEGAPDNAYSTNGFRPARALRPDEAGGRP